MAEKTLDSTVTVDEGTPTRVQGGETITAGMAVYKDATTKEHMKALCDTSAHAEVEGVAVTGGGDGQDMLIAGNDCLLGGLTGLVAGMWYVLSKTTAGSLMPVADLASTNYSTLVGYAPSMTTFRVKIIASGVALA